MKIVSIIASLVFAGVIAQAADTTAPAGHADHTAPVATETTTTKKEVTKKNKHAAPAAPAAAAPKAEDKKAEAGH